MAQSFAAFLAILHILFLPWGVVPDARAGQDPAVFRFGAITLNHPLVIYQQYQPFIDYVSEKQPWRYELVLERSYAGILDRLAAGTLDVALVAGRTFLQARERLDLVPVCAVRAADGSLTTRSLIVVRDDRTDIRSLQDLKGRSMAFGSPDSTASFMVPVAYLIRHGLGLDSFARWVNLSTHDAVARAVLRGTFDAGAVGEPMAQRYLGSGLRVLDATEPFPGFLIVARASLPDEAVAALRDTLLAIDPADPDVAARSGGWYELFRHGFGPADEKAYEIFREMDRMVGTPGGDGNAGETP